LTKHHGANGRVLAVEAQENRRITGEAGPMWSQAGPLRCLQGPLGSSSITVLVWAGETLSENGSSYRKGRPTGPLTVPVLVGGV
jgi:hypothetical protein